MASPEAILVALVVTVIAIALLAALVYRCVLDDDVKALDTETYLLGATRATDDSAEEVRYAVQRKLGDGTFGTVYLAKRKEDGLLVAIKVVPCANDRQARDALNEYEACKFLQGHPNVVKLLDMFEDSPMPSRRAGQLYGSVGYNTTILAKLRIAVSKTSAAFVCTVHEYYSRGTLFDLLARKRCGLPEATVWEYVKQLLCSLIFMHSNNLLHRDVKPSNVLLSSDEKRIALTDFGLAREAAIGEYVKTKIGTYHYMAPEQIEDQRYNAKADVWAVGCVAYGLCTAKVSTRDAVVMFLARKNPAFATRLTAEFDALGYSSALSAFVLQLLEYDPSARPTADEALHALRLATEVPPHPNHDAA